MVHVSIFRLYMVVLEYGLEELPEPLVWPNPFTNDINVSMKVPVSGTLDVRLYDALGRSVSSSTHPVDKGLLRLTLTEPAPSAPGAYFLEFRVDGHRFMTRLVKQ